MTFHNLSFPKDIDKLLSASPPSTISTPKKLPSCLNVRTLSGLFLSKDCSGDAGPGEKMPHRGCSQEGGDLFRR